MQLATILLHITCVEVHKVPRKAGWHNMAQRKCEALGGLISSCVFSLFLYKKGTNKDYLIKLSHIWVPAQSRHSIKIRWKSLQIMSWKKPASFLKGEFYCPPKQMSMFRLLNLVRLYLFSKPHQLFIFRR